MSTLLIKIGNLTFRDAAYMSTTIAHELFHRAQLLTGEQFVKTGYELEVGAYNFTLTEFAKSSTKEELTESRTALNTYKQTAAKDNRPPETVPQDGSPIARRYRAAGASMTQCQ